MFTQFLTKQNSTAYFVKTMLVQVKLIFLTQIVESIVGLIDIRLECI